MKNNVWKTESKEDNLTSYLWSIGENPRYFKAMFVKANLAFKPDLVFPLYEMLEEDFINWARSSPATHDDFKNAELLN